MKRLFLFLPVLIIPVFFMSSFRISNLTSHRNNNSGLLSDTTQVFPDSVHLIVQNSCIGCHSTTSHSEKAKGKLNFDEWDSFSPVKKISKLNDIHKEVNEGKMPPEKFLDRFPDKKLTELQKKTILDWTDQEIKKIMN